MHSQSAIGMQKRKRKQMYRLLHTATTKNWKNMKEHENQKIKIPDSYKVQKTFLTPTHKLSSFTPTARNKKHTDAYICMLYACATYKSAVVNCSKCVCTFALQLDFPLLCTCLPDTIIKDKNLWCSISFLVAEESEHGPTATSSKFSYNSCISCMQTYKNHLQFNIKSLRYIGTYFLSAFSPLLHCVDVHHYYELKQLVHKKDQRSKTSSFLAFFHSLSLCYDQERTHPTKHSIIRKLLTSAYWRKFERQLEEKIILI